MEISAALLEVELHPDVDALRPEIGIVPGESRPCGARQAGAANAGLELCRIDGPVNGITGPNHIAPIQEVVAHHEVNAGRQMQAEGDFSFGQECHFIVGKVAAIGWLSQHSSGKRGHGPVGTGDRRVAENGYFLMREAHTQ